MSDAAGGHRLAVNPTGADIVAATGETLMHAGLRAGYRWPTICEGRGSCTTCYVLVESGAQNLSPIGDREREALPPLLMRHPRAAPGEVRLACQARVYGEVTVFKRGVRRARGRAASSPPVGGKSQ